MSHHQQAQHKSAAVASVSSASVVNTKSDHSSPKLLRKRPQSVSLARVLVYDGGGGACSGGGGGETSSSNNSLNSSTSETTTTVGGGGRRHFHLHHHHGMATHGSGHAAASEDEAAFRKLNLGSANPIFGSVSGSHHRNHHHLYHPSSHHHSRAHYNQHHHHHHSLTIPSRGGSTDATAAVSETNLIRVRSSALGKSAPSLSQAMVSFTAIEVLT